MKKSLVLTFIIVMLISFGWSGSFNKAAQANDRYVSAEKEYNFSDIIDISTSGAGVNTGDNAGHGGHQTRIVHTEHGDYAAYITDSIKANGGKQMDEFSIIKINNDGTTKVIFREYKVYDTSQVGVFSDKDGNVWAVTVGDNKLKAQFDGRADAIIATAYRIDKDTEEATGYNVLVQRATFSGYGYSSFCYDKVSDKIYTLTSSGDAPGELIWLIFDMKTLTWDGQARAVKTNNRQCYPYIYADGKGGMIILNERDIRCTNAGYPEVSSNDGLTANDLRTFERWSAEYLWDQLELYYIPDVYKEEYTSVLVAEADYSRVKGDTQQERNSLEFRKTNAYPNFQNNRGGDTFLDKDGYLHVIYAKEYSLAAYTREAVERTWIHAVYDVSDPNDMKLLSSTDIIEDAKLPYQCSFRMYQDNSGTLYMISGQTDRKTSKGKVIVYELIGTPTEGYKQRNEVASAPYTGDSIINISNNRSNSYADNKIAVLFMSGNTYKYMQISIIDKNAPVEPTPTPGDNTPKPTENPGDPSETDSNIVWYIVCGIVVLAGVAAAVYFTVAKKKKKE